MSIYQVSCPIGRISAPRQNIDDVRHWFIGALYGGNLHKYRMSPTARSRQSPWLMVVQCILPLTGPAGSGRTATVKVLARELAFDLIEGKNSIADGDMSSFLDLVFTSFNHSTPLDLDAVSQLDGFRVVLTRASTSRSVFGGPSSKPTVRQVILLGDLPKILHADAQENFHDTPQLFVEWQTSQSG